VVVSPPPHVQRRAHVWSHRAWSDSHSTRSQHTVTVHGHSTQTQHTPTPTRVPCNVFYLDYSEPVSDADLVLANATCMTFPRLQAHRAHMQPEISPALAKTKKFAWLRAAARAGFARAQNELGVVNTATSTWFLDHFARVSSLCCMPPHTREFRSGDFSTAFALYTVTAHGHSTLTSSFQDGFDLVTLGAPHTGAV